MIPEGSCKGFTCFSGTCLRDGLQYDMVGDCEGLAQEDERNERSSNALIHFYTDMNLHFQFILWRLVEKWECCPQVNSQCKPQPIVTPLYYSRVYII